MKKRKDFLIFGSPRIEEAEIREVEASLRSGWLGTGPKVHDLRHTFASRQGLSDRIKQIIGGWSSKQVMEKTYMHTPEDYVREEYFKVDFIPKSKN